MVKKGFIAFTAITSIYASSTQTTFSQAQYTGKDQYGNAIYERDVTISTEGYKVKNFWKGFSLKGEGQKESNFKVVSKKGKFQIIVEPTSACVLDTFLPSQGCSGQKPFLLNDEVLHNPIAGTNDQFEVAFTLAKDYTNSDENGFYPLDIQRDAKYYKDISQTSAQSSKKSFFSFFTSAFDYLFSKTIGFGRDFFGEPDIADVQEGAKSDAAMDRRQRYIANIMAGVEQNYRMSMPTSNSIATEVLAGSKLNDPVSLLNYAEAKKVTTKDQCKFMFMNLSSEGLMCRVMSGFAMDVWMPFFNKAKIRTIETNTIMADTENSLLAMTAQIEAVPYMQDIGGTDEEKLSFLQNMLKPMRSMIDFMKTMFFGSTKADKVADPVEKVYNYSEDNATTLNFAITNDGVQVDDFQSFKLLAIRSVYGDMLDSCRVKKTPGMLSWSHWEKTFYLDIPDSQKGPNGSMSNTEWVEWCQEATGSKGMFDYLFDWSTGGIFNPLNWMRSFFNAFLAMITGSYKIEDFTSQVKHGLILDLKKTDLDPVSKLNRRIIKIKNID